MIEWVTLHGHRTQRHSPRLARVQVSSLASDGAVGAIAIDAQEEKAFPRSLGFEKSQIQVSLQIKLCKDLESHI